jgi:cyclohexanecarboxylate-CoA ligase
MTELFMGLNTRLDDAEGVRCGCVGRPTPEMEVRIVDDVGQDIGNSDSGELQIRGPSVFAGYYDNAEANEGAFVDGWFRTGDLACRDSEGNFQITGRLKDLINRGGIKINPIDVEVLIDKHPKVLQSAIVPMPDEIMGEKACAFVVPRDGQTVTLQEDEMAGTPRAHQRDAAHAHPQDHQGRTAATPILVARMSEAISGQR